MRIQSILLAIAVCVLFGCTAQQGDVLARALGDAMVAAVENKTRPDTEPATGSTDPYPSDPYPADPYPADPYATDPYANDPYPADPGVVDPGYGDPGPGYGSGPGYSDPGPGSGGPAYDPGPGPGGPWAIAPTNPPLLPPSTQRFDAPRSGAFYVDNCLHWASDCGQPAADRFCQDQGYARASDFVKKVYGGRTQQGVVVEGTYVQGDNKTCGEWFCTGFSHVNCSS